jgi:hypothetical protein
MPALRTPKLHRTGSLSVTVSESKSRTLQADEFDWGKGIISIMVCFLDDFSPRTDWPEKEGT